MNAASRVAPTERGARREQRRAFLRYFRHPGFCTGAVILLALCVVAVAAPPEPVNDIETPAVGIY